MSKDEVIAILNRLHEAALDEMSNLMVIETIPGQSDAASNISIKIQEEIDKLNA
jgi:hypothetical protein